MMNEKKNADFLRLQALIWFFVKYSLRLHGHIANALFYIAPIEYTV